MSGSTWESWRISAPSSVDGAANCGRRSTSSLAFDGASDLLRAWTNGLTPDPALTVSAWADQHRILSPRGASEAGPWRTSAHALPARADGRAQSAPSGAAGRVHEGQPAGGERERLQLDRLCDPPCAGADAGGAAVGRAGQALLPAADRPADRGEPGSAREGGAGALAGQRQHGAVEGVPRRHPGDDRRQLGRRPALDAGALSVPRRGRRLSAVGRRRGRPGDAGRSAGRGRSRGGARCSSPRRRRSGACQGSSGSTRPPTRGASSCPVRTADTPNT